MSGRGPLCCRNSFDFVYMSSSSHFCAGQRLTQHNRTLDVRPGRITKKLELKYDYDCERDDTKSLLAGCVDVRL